MADLTDVASQILAATRVATDAANAKPGEPVNISVFPGFSPQVPTDFTLTGTVGLVTGGLGPIAGELAAVVSSVKVVVKYSVTKDGAPTAAYEATPPLVNDAAVSDPLNVAFLFRPPVGEDVSLTRSFQYVVEIAIKVEVEDGFIAETGAAPKPPPIRIPVDVPPLPFPTVLVVTKHSRSDWRFPGQTLVMLKAASPHRTLGDLVKTVRELTNYIDKLKAVLQWTPIPNPTQDISLVADIISAAPMVYLALNGARDFDDFGSFDDESSALLFVAPTGAKVTLYSKNKYEYDPDDMGDADETAATVTAQDIGSAFGVQTGIGVSWQPSLYYSNVWRLNLLHDKTGSAHFGGLGTA